MTKGLRRLPFCLHGVVIQGPLSETLARQKQLDEHTMRLQRFFTSSELYPDNQGRVSIPAKLREYAKIGAAGRSGRWSGPAAGSRFGAAKSWAAYNEELTAEMITESARELGIA